MSGKIVLIINGRPHKVQAEPDTPHFEGSTKNQSSGVMYGIQTGIQ